MKVNDRWYRTIWPIEDGRAVEIIDQTRLPNSFEIVRLDSLESVAAAITEMKVRGAPLIGATAAYGICLALQEDSSDEGLEMAVNRLAATRPTAINLRWALDQILDAVRSLDPSDRPHAALVTAASLCDDDVATCRRIGEHGLEKLKKLAGKKKGERLEILTHCNAGWLATVDWGTALAPIYFAHEAGIPVHVWVDETRPRNQGAALTAFELGAHGVPHTLIADNVGGHLMQHRMVDVCLVGSDRTTAYGDVANKIGTYLKALAAHDNEVPFYVCLPSTTIDWSLGDGIVGIPIEERSPDEVLVVAGRLKDGLGEVEIAPPGCVAANYAFDVTPARLVSGLITEKGVCDATPKALRSLFPEKWVLAEAGD